MKTTKRALFSSVVALILCFSMLVGTTFAWFTDSVESGMNTIVAGNLDVELYYQVEGQTDWTKVEANTNVFMENALWEPGHTEVVKLKIVNEGTLALKYQLGVNVASETGSVNVKGQEFKLSEFIKYGIVDGAQTYTRDQAIAAVDATATALNVAWNSGTTQLLVDDPDTTDAKENEKIVTMVVYMPTSVGNEANYAKGENIPTINLGINVFATQLAAEEDSFGKNYDEEAWNKEFLVTSAEDLQDALANVKDGDVIKFASDIEFSAKTAGYNDGTYVDGVRYTGDKSFTIDFNGFIVTDDGCVNDYLLYFNNKGEKANEITLKNGTVVSENGCWSTVCLNSSAATQETVLNLENMNVINSNDATYSGNLAVRARDKATVNVNKGTVITSDGASYGVAASTSNAVVNIYNGATVIQKNSGNSGGNSVFAAVGGKGVVNIYDGAVIESDKYGVHTMTTGTPVINVKGGTITAVVALKASTNGAADQLATINVTGGIIKGKLETYTDNGHIVVSGGIFNTDPSAYVAVGVRAAESNGLYYVVSENIDAVITTADELVSAFANLSAGDVLYIAADVDMTGKTLAPVTGNKGFTMLGNGYTISNLNSTAAGLFVNKSGSSSYTFERVILENCSVNSATNYGALFVGDGDTSDAITITECQAINCTVKSAKYAAAFVAYTAGYNVQNNGPVYSDVAITDCSVIGGSITGGGSTGAAVGHSGGNDDTTTTITNLQVKDVVITGEDAAHTGIVVGTANVGDTIINNIIYSNVTGNHNGIYGRFVPGTTGTLVIDGASVLSAATNEELTGAISSNNAKVYLPNGNYTLPAVSNNNVTISGTKDAVITVNKPNYSGSNVTLNGVTVKGSGYATGVQHVNTVTYNDVTIVGEMCLYGEKVVFNNCTFELNGQYIWTYGAKEVEFINCTFNTTGKAILVYNEGAGASKVTVKHCTFNATAGAKAGAIANQNCAAIEIDNFQSSGTGAAHVVITEGNTYGENFSGEWRIKNVVAGNAITVNGNEYTQIAVDGKLMTIDANKNVTIVE